MNDFNRKTAQRYQRAAYFLGEKIIKELDYILSSNDGSIVEMNGQLYLKIRYHSIGDTVYTHIKITDMQAKILVHDFGVKPLEKKKCHACGRKM